MEDSQKDALDFLLEEEAQDRANRISSTEYKLQFLFKKASKSYDGKTSIKFNLKGDKLFKDSRDVFENELFLDFVGSKIHSIHINNQEIAGEEKVIWQSSRVHFHPSLFQEGTNHITIQYTSEFSHNGSGMHQTLVNNEEFYYTDFEPYYAHQLFPHFDQPSLKASFEVEVTAPSEWMCITCTPLIKSMQEDGMATWKSSQASPPLCSYLLPLIFGNFVLAAEGEAISGSKKVPIRYFCRPALQEAVTKRGDALVSVAAKSIEFFTDMFDFEYPFFQHDLVFVPDTNQHGMENVGGITLHECLATASTFLADFVIAHETAHMWFGNLASPWWWDMLWFNEGFADAVSEEFILQKCPEHHFAFMNKMLSSRTETLEQDSTESSHAVKSRVTDTSHALLTFDSVTYTKSSTSIGQLITLIGMPAFKEGIQKFFKSHQWKFTSLEDFLDDMEEAHSKTCKGERISLKKWAQEWLQTKGVNQLTVEHEIRGGIVEKIRIHQTSSHPDCPCRTHRVELAWCKKNESGKVVVAGSTWVTVLAQEFTDIPQLCGMEEPECFILDYSNRTLAAIIPDSKTQKFALNNIGLVEDRNVRLLLWRYLQLLVNNEMILPSEVIRTIVAQFKAEESDSVRDFVIGIYLSTIRLVPADVRAKWRTKMREWCHEIIQLRISNSVTTTFAFILWSFSEHEKDVVEQLYHKIDADFGIEGFQVPGQLWTNVIVGAYAHKIDGIEERLENLIAKMPYLKGVKAATADPQVKMDWYKWMTFQNDSPQVVMNMMPVLFLPYQKDVTKVLRQQFYQDAVVVTRKKTLEFLHEWIRGMFSADPEEEGIYENVQMLLDQLSDNGNDLCLKGYLTKFLESAERKKRIWELERKANL